MPFNGSGIFSRIYSWTNDAAASIKIRADRMDNEMNGFATGLSTCLTKDGQTTVTANLPMAGFRHTGVGNATARSNYASFAQAQDGVSNWVVAGGTADAITATYSIPITAVIDGQLCFVRATAANATTTPTFSPNGLSALPITRIGGVALSVGDIAGAGHELILRLNITNRWELLNPRSEVTLAGTQTLTNKTLTNPTINAAGGSITLPASGSPTPTTDGQIAWDSDDNRIVVGDGASQKIFESFVAPASHTPATSALVNASAATITAGQFYRHGNFVHVWGSGTLDPTTASVATSFKMPLPVSTASTAIYGTMNSTDYQGTCFGIIAGGSNTALFSGVPSSASVGTFTFHFSYPVT